MGTTKTNLICPHCGKEIEVEMTAKAVDAETAQDGQQQTQDSQQQEAGSQQSTGDTKRLTFTELIERFNDVLLQRGYRQIDSVTDVWGYLSWAYNFASVNYDSNSWMFQPETYPLVHDYRGQDNRDGNTAYNAMQAWLMASILAELVADCGETINTQTKLFTLAYELGGGGIEYPLYYCNTLKADPYAMREAASIIYAICRSDKNIAAQIDNYRYELGGKPIPATVWEDLGYKNEMLSDYQGRRGYRMTNLGYLVNTDDFLPDAPGPRIEGTTVCDLPWPWEEGQIRGDFREESGNYFDDEEINDFFVAEYNMMSQTPLSVWESYSREKQNRLVNAAAVPPCTYMYMFGAPKKVQFDGIVHKTYDGSIYADYYTFSETDKDTGLVLDGPFSDLAGIYRFNVANKNARETFIERITAIADNFRFPTQDPNYGRCRPGCKPTREGGELNPVHGAAENELYNIDLTAMVADTEEQRQRMLREDGFAQDSPRSYVSGHSAQIWMLALMLTQMDEDSTARPQQWVRKAFEYSVNRSLGRFHWNSDVVYGRLFGAMALPILNAMTGLRDGYEATKQFVQNPQPQPAPEGDWEANLIIWNLSGETILSTGEIRLYVGEHIGVNTYLPDAWEGAGQKYTFNTGENDFSDKDVHCVLNGESRMDDAYDGMPITEVRFYDYRHWQNIDAGFNAVLDTGDARCDRTLKKAGGTYVIKITKIK